MSKISAQNGKFEFQDRLTVYNCRSMYNTFCFSDNVKTIYKKYQRLFFNLLYIEHLTTEVKMLQIILIRALKK